MISEKDYQQKIKNLEQLAKDTDRIKEAMNTIEEQRKDSLGQLEELKNRLPEILSAAFLQEMPDSEVSKIKTRIVAVESFIGDAPLITKGLQDRLKTKQEDAKHAAEKNHEYNLEREYERVKQEFESIPLGDKKRRELLDTFQKISKRTGHMSEFNRLTK
ncbi:MAG: hypothetical protein C4522_22080 [Desulfobacteraceae bacterium]|nr:MAG: hypothetical protein C4522_22080 [Desulfobacteraceae bacterium]